MPSMDTKPEYQHYIPQFLLRNFAHQYAPPGKSKAGKSGKRNRKKKMYPGDPVVNSLSLTDPFSLEECLVKRVCGLENMYENPEKPVNVRPRLEKQFGEFEGRASRIYRQIINAYKNGNQHVWLGRVEKDVLRKFMALLTFRGNQYYQRYNVDSMQEYHEDDKEILQAYMSKHGFTKPVDVWLQGLEKIIDLDMDLNIAAEDDEEDGEDWEQRIRERIYSPIAEMFIEHMSAMYMAICTPASDDEEFILTENCYNVTEGQTTAYYDSLTGKHVTLSPRFHMFAPISPRLIIVLRSNHLPDPLEDADPISKCWRQFNRLLFFGSQYGRGPKSILEDLPIRKAMNNYMDVVNGMLAPRHGWNQQLGMSDRFRFTIFQIPTRHVQTINGLLIDHAFHGSRIIFDRKDVFLDLMEWYLTEPCEVGKNILGEHAAKQSKYIDGLTDFMSREGRQCDTKQTIWPSEDRDLNQLRIQKIAEARFMEEVGRRKGDASFDVIKIHERLGGMAEDLAKVDSMFQTWIICVDMEWSSPTYESSRPNKLASLLEEYQGGPCCRFWLFLRHMRLSQIIGNRKLELGQVFSLLDKESCWESEDILTFG
ncbi:hypothetical protein M441DRAFT_302523 [Trichoderma asperellum CBS 433.97]|uniref:DUF4238 domain-containing protein n=1 Tax=Trichoderma asperellum (strain ATCC 204424 / CBS 433.97 / NBRC 101777) TaxID=1042311 RepID=A0A2T3ZJG4_TRIA4|nr:hypothetical protein M441DRAFT_302523 [Trichoderma asperellum CBS 433.97]PTB44947.1 hypothetical protein M441DRAFT_302523 [Trichoderma asperellum CBS 433.97]